MFQKKLWFGLLFIAVSISFAACGYKKPAYESVEQNITTPTGVVNADITGLALGSYNATSTATPFLGAHAGFKFLKSDQFAPISLGSQLKQAGVPQGILAKITQYLPHNNDYTFQKQPKSEQTAGFSIPGCFSFSGNTKGKVRTGEIYINLGCAGDGSGSLTIRFDGWDNAGASGSGSLELIFDDACSEKGDCVDGVLGLKMKGSSDKARIIYSYHFKVTEGSSSLTAKGGFRLSINGKKSGKLEVVAFAKQEGKEVAVVLVYERKGEKAKFSVRGKNGSYSCSTKDHGETGSCSLSSSKGEQFNWTRGK